MTKNQVMNKRRAFLLGLGTMAGTGAVVIAGGFKRLNNHEQALDDEEREFALFGEASLRNRAAAKGFIYGASSSYRVLSSNREFAVRFPEECAILVPENDLKWPALRPSPNSFNFTRGDWLYQFARSHGMLFRGHTLAWHGGLPKWFKHTVGSHNARQVLLEHITTVVGHYAGKMHSWDVVNEAVLPKDGRSDGLRNTPWLKFLGPDYIDIAFRATAEADPQALLVYNDYGLEYDTREQEAKRTAVLKLLERLKSIGTPVHALGIQSHLWKPRFNSRKFSAFLHDVSGLGLKIMITEMDVVDKLMPLDVNTRDRMVARVYEDYLSVVLDEPAVIGVLTWGLSDRYTWLAKTQSGKDRAPVRPLPLDAELRRKPAWNAIARAFDKAPTR